MSCSINTNNHPLAGETTSHHRGGECHRRRLHEGQALRPHGGSLRPPERPGSPSSGSGFIRAAAVAKILRPEKGSS